MKKLLTVLLLACLLEAGTTTIRAQDVGVTLSVGMASMRMDDMKYLLETIIDAYPVEAKMTSAFPPYTSVSAGAVYQRYPHVRLGAAYGYTTSGAKADYTDYSGYLRTTVVAKSHRLGVYGAYLPLSGDRLELSLIGRVDLNLTLAAVSTTLSAAHYFYGLTEKYKSISPQGSVWADLMLKLGKINLGVEGGYLVDLAGGLKSTPGGKALSDPNDVTRKLSSDWTGWRAGIKVIYWLDFSGS